MLQRLQPKRQDRVGVLLQIRKKRLVVNHAVLDDLAQPREQLPLRQRRKAGKVDENALGLIKRADQVFSEAMIDRHLAANAGIDLRQEARRHLHERHAAHIRCGNESREVADDAAAQRDNRRFPVKPLLDGFRIDMLRFRQRLRAFPRRNEMDRRLFPHAPENLRNLFRVELAHVRIGKDQRPGGKIRALKKGSEFRFQTVPNQDIVTVFRQIDAHLTHEEYPLPAKNP